MPHRRSLITLAVVALLLIALSTTASAATYPNSIASTGDSITRAFNTGFFPFTDAPANSWSTGTNLTVSSQYLRLLALTPSISGKNYNDARSGARMADLSGQMTLAGGQSAVTVKNQNGVRIRLISTNRGVDVSVAKGGVEMKLKEKD